MVKAPPATVLVLARKETHNPMQLATASCYPTAPHHITISFSSQNNEMTRWLLPQSKCAAARAVTFTESPSGCWCY